ncbi:MAG TPA: FAD:protein FMN transferase [Aggregatilineales bacterium]|nr:FAD:protein FMN transferase [Aggregatilineales bacterium]
MGNYTVQFTAMGSHIQAWLNAPSLQGSQILKSLPQWFEIWEAKFSRFRPTSELCDLNRHAGEWMTVSAPLYEVITLAVQGAEATGGLFNPLILPALRAAGYDHSFEAGDFVPGPAALARTNTTADFHEIGFRPADRSIRLPAHSEIDLGGIAKGWSAQQAAGILAALGPCLIDAGGDLVAVGSPDESGGWLVRIPDPRTSEIAHTVLLCDAAIATSGRDYRQWVRDGRALHHIIDPRTREPAASTVLSASVIAPGADGAEAEIWAKTMMLDPTRAHPFPALLFHDDGSIAMDSEFEALCRDEMQ